MSRCKHGVWSGDDGGRCAECDQEALLDAEGRLLQTHGELKEKLRLNAAEKALVLDIYTRLCVLAEMPNTGLIDPLGTARECAATARKEGLL